ncbi:MAG: hypothetical protein ACFCUG_00795 [Thiotrichales bacterium]
MLKVAHARPVRRPRLLTLLVGVVFSSGCAVMTKVETGLEHIDRKVSTAMKKRGLQPKVEQLASADEIWVSEACGSRPLPYLKLTRHDMYPATAIAGSTVNHRFEYHLCARNEVRPLSGDLTRRIFFAGRPVLTDTSPDVELQPGHWLVDAFITVPERAPAGAYEVEVKFEGNDARFRERTRLEIAKP